MSQHEAQLQEWVCRERMQLTRVHELLLERLGVKVGYMGLYRFVLARGWLPAHRGTVRMAATKPGEVVEVDFGYLGRIADETGRLRKAWAFSAVLPFSRHMHVTITFKKDIPAAIAAFEGGVGVLSGRAAPGRAGQFSGSRRESQQLRSAADPHAGGVQPAPRFPPGRHQDLPPQGQAAY